MFATETTTLLAHPLPAVAALLGRVSALPRWCGGVRRAHHAGGIVAPCGPAGCEISYAIARDVRLLLMARTVAREPGGPIVHVAQGDGVTLTWSFTLAEEAGPGLPAVAHTRVIARTELVVDAAHPTMAHRAAISRLIARRAPEDVARLAALLDRPAVAMHRAPLASTHP